MKRTYSTEVHLALSRMHLTPVLKAVQRPAGDCTRVCLFNFCLKIRQMLIYSTNFD